MYEKKLTGDNYSSKLPAVASISIQDLLKICTSSLSCNNFMDYVGLQVLTNVILVVIHFLGNNLI